MVLCISYCDFIQVENTQESKQEWHYMPAIGNFPYLLFTFSYFSFFQFQCLLSTTYFCRIWRREYSNMLRKPISNIFISLLGFKIYFRFVSFLQNGQQIVDEPMGEDDINQQTVSKRWL